MTHVGLGTAVTHTQGCWEAESQQKHSKTWNFTLFQRERLSGMQWPAMSNSSCLCTRWDNTLGHHHDLLCPPRAVPMAPSWIMACSSSCPPQNAGKPPQNALLRDKGSLCKGGITSGRWHCTTGLILVTGGWGCPGAASVCSSRDFFCWEKGKERPQHLLPRALPTVLSSGSLQSSVKGTIP